jgi:hypothetical protein
MMNEKLEQIDITLKDFESFISEFVQQDKDSYDMNDAFSALYSIAEMKRKLSRLEDDVNLSMVLFMKMSGEKQHDFGSHVVERRVSSRRKNWQHGTLVEAVINTSLSDEETVLIDPNTGEVLDIITIAKPLIDNVIRNLTATAAIRDWRVTALKNIVPGLNPDDFCEVEKSEKVSILRK